METDEIRRVLRRHADELRSRYRVGFLALFGSAARREATETSDVDLLVEFETEPTFDLFMDLKFRLEELLGRPVDLVTRAGLRDGLKERVEREAVRVA